MDRGATRRIATVDDFAFPGSVRQRFAAEHSELTSDQLRLVEAATRQWFRLAARHPKAKLSMPSVVVDDLWHELVLHTRDYGAFCTAAFGRFLHHQPETAMSTEAAAANASTLLAATLELARQDEHCEPPKLPILFRIDQELKVEGGRHYLADCGGRGQCFPLLGTTCLEHLAGTRKRLGFTVRSNPRGAVAPGEIYVQTRGNSGAGGGAGCGGGGGCGGGCGSS